MIQRRCLEGGYEERESLVCLQREGGREGEEDGGGDMDLEFGGSGKRDLAVLALIVCVFLEHLPPSANFSENN